MRASLLLTVSWIVCLCGATTATAAQLQRDTLVRGAEIRLSDLFTDIDPDQDVVLGQAPAPGDRITVGAAQLSAIAAQFGIDWTSTSGREYRILRRDGIVVDDATVRRKVQQAQIAAGVSSGGAVIVNEHPPLVVDSGSDVELSSFTADGADSHFHAEIVARLRGREVARYPISGTIELTSQIMVVNRDLPAGTMLEVDDLVPTVIARSRTGEGTVHEAAQAVGKVTTQALRAGMPIRLQDMHRPFLVAKGGSVLVLLSGDGVDVTAQGQAIDGGALDDKVRVLNIASHAILTGDVVGPAEVRIAAHSIPIFVPAWKALPIAHDPSLTTAGSSALSMLAPAP